MTFRKEKDIDAAPPIEKPINVIFEASLIDTELEKFVGRENSPIISLFLSELRLIKDLDSENVLEYGRLMSIANEVIILENINYNSDPNSFDSRIKNIKKIYDENYNYYRKYTFFKETISNVKKDKYLKDIIVLFTLIKNNKIIIEEFLAKFNYDLKKLEEFLLINYETINHTIDAIISALSEAENKRQEKINHEHFVHIMQKIMADRSDHRRYN